MGEVALIVCWIGLIEMAPPTLGGYADNASGGTVLLRCVSFDPLLQPGVYYPASFSLCNVGIEA